MSPPSEEFVVGQAKGAGPARDRDDFEILDLEARQEVDNAWTVVVTGGRCRRAAIDPEPHRNGLDFDPGEVIRSNWSGRTHCSGPNRQLFLTDRLRLTAPPPLEFEH